jgi:hypothetical protein
MSHLTLTELCAENLWVGTERGAARWNRTDGTWRYFYLQRYLPGNSIVSSVCSNSPNFTVVGTDGGIAILESQLWTLAQKAEYMESIMEPMFRHGLVSGCSLSSFGNTPSCTPEANESDAIWTGLLLAAETMRYVVTGAQDALERALLMFDGMQMLFTITGVEGLIARTVLDPTEPRPGGGEWYNSTVPEYEGWIWQGNASSDDVTGHMFALPIFAKLMNQSMPASQAAAQLIGHLVHYIVENDFYLIDVNGEHTQWGVWNPAFINLDPSWSDGRLVGLSFFSF